MPRHDLTDITLVLDRSGSMSVVRESTITAFNEFLRSQRAAAGSARMTLVQFDHEYEPLYEDVPINQAKELNADTFVPRGSTALLDAMGRTIINTGKRLAGIPEEERPGTVLFVTLTDGHENSSREFDMRHINEMITEQRNTYSWQVIFLAANQDAIATAAQMGISADQALTFASSDQGVQASFQAVDSHVRHVRERRAAGKACAPVAFTPKQRKKAGG